jgi:signal transduction histidine kinase
LEPVDAGALVREAAQAWGALAGARGSELVVEPAPGPARVLADPLRLLQACGNLVANALEHGEGPVRVRARAAGRRVRIEVADAGPGLPAPVPVLVAAARGRRTARGHGLAIAASIAERHGGRLLTAPAATGARLVLELPEAPPGRSTTPGPRRRTIRSAPADPPRPGARSSGPPASSGGPPRPGTRPAAGDPPAS